MKKVITACLILVFAATCAAQYSPMPDSIPIGKHPKAKVPFDLARLKALWKDRIAAIRADGQLPVIDIESSFDAGKLNAQDYAKSMDDNGVALTAFSPQVSEKKYKKDGMLWHDGARRAVGADPYRYIPTSTAGIYPAFTESPEVFVEKTIAMVEMENYPMMGEFEFRHYMSPRQLKRGETFRDITIPIDSAAGHKLFQFSERSGLSFQIHYEVEDNLLPPLEKMLAQYPKAKVIWCHLGQVRYAKRAKKYGPDYVRKLIEKYPNIYFDLAFGDANSVYPGSGEHHARVWKKSGGGVEQFWIDLITDYPYRFVAALDIGGDRMDHLAGDVRTLRAFMDCLPQKTREVVAYKAAWKLLFDEDIQ